MDEKQQQQQPRTRLREWLDYGITQGVHVHSEGRTFIVDWVGSMSVQGRELVPIEGEEGIVVVENPSTMKPDETTPVEPAGYRRKDKYGPTKSWDIREFVLTFGLSVGHLCLRCKQEFDVTGADPPDSQADCPRCD